MKDENNKQAINDYYRQTNLESNINAAFEKAGRDISNYKDTESMDEFHIRGREATRELAGLAGFKSGMEVLDLGCGIGGPARLLATEFGCIATGIELVEEYCQAGNMISQRAGLAHMVRIQQGDMANLFFDNESFDAAWTLHTIMNIADKSRLFESVVRVLKPGGLFALYEICAGTHFPPCFPVPWAADESMSFLLSPDDLRLSILKKGFEEVHWQDVSPLSVEWFQSIAKSRAETNANAVNKVNMKSGRHAKRSRPGISLLLGKTAAEKSKNIFRNLTEDRIRTVFGVFQKPPELR